MHGVNFKKANMTEDERTRRSCFKNQTEKGSEKKYKLREVYDEA